MKAELLTRVRYSDRQFLRATDFVDEQSYHLAIHRRHALTHHTPGILAGLTFTIEDEVVRVTPGIAIDGYGRELVLPQASANLRPDFDRLKATTLYVYLFYQRLSPGTENNPCDPGSAPYRWEETGSIKVFTSRVQPPTNEDLETPDDPERLWPVELGILRYELITKKVEPDLTGRTYAGVVASSVRHPVEAVSVELGQGENLFQVKADDQKLVEITKSGNFLHGHTTVEGTLRLAGGAIQFEAIEGAPPSFPAMYHANDKGQLRIDLGDASGNKTFVIGHTQDDDFKPAITLAFEPADGGTWKPKVTIHGDLTVEGLNASNTKFRILSPEALNALQAMFQTGLAAGGQ